ncbi:histidine phosphatase superfamily [Biscogniauxia marginata]|nr:histidine phosphatase superfamily [Biscogniauxia marginata]
MVPTIDIVRHAEARHNVEGNYLRDPELTAQGIQQCSILCNTYPYMQKVTHIVSSPLRRAIQTTLLCFGPVSAKIVLLPELQETTARPSDTGSPRQRLQEEFGNRIDTSCLLTDDWYLKDASTIFASDPKKVKESARLARVWLREIVRKAGPDDHIVVVTHSGFVGSLISGPEVKFGNAEFRSCEFAELDGKDNEAILVEKKVE